MDLDSTGIRQRKSAVKKIVEDLDIFEKVVDNVKEDKKVSAGLLSIVCFGLIAFLVTGELWTYFISKKHYDYRFDVDVAHEEMPMLEIDMIVASSCGKLSVVSSMDQPGMSGPSSQGLKKDATRFEFTDEEQLYWTILRHAHATMTRSGQRALEDLHYIDDDVEETLEHLADEKQEEENVRLKEESAKAGAKPSRKDGVVFLIGNGMGMFQLVASSGASDDSGTACRVHGRFPVRKGREEKVIVSISNLMEMAVMFGETADSGKMANVSHRIERFNFGPRINGLVTPLAGAEQISQTGQDVYRYFIKVVPTRIYKGFFDKPTTAYQYSVTFLKKEPVEGEHSHGGILFEYEFVATVIEIREITVSLLTLLLRLCAVVGGVYATSNIVNNLVQLCLGCLHKTAKTHASAVVVNEEKVSLIDPMVMVH